jgi:hypothetical protein
MSFTALLLAYSVAAATTSTTTVEIAPGVNMPFANLGGSDGAQSNYTFGLAAGFRQESRDSLTVM